MKINKELLWRSLQFLSSLPGSKCLDICFGSRSGFPSTVPPSASMGSVWTTFSNRQASCSGYANIVIVNHCEKPSGVRPGIFGTRRTSSWMRWCWHPKSRYNWDICSFDWTLNIAIDTHIQQQWQTSLRNRLTSHWVYLLFKWKGSVECNELFRRYDNWLFGSEVLNLPPSLKLKQLQKKNSESHLRCDLRAPEETDPIEEWAFCHCRTAWL